MQLEHVLQIQRQQRAREERELYVNIDSQLVLAVLGVHDYVAEDLRRHER